MGTLGKAPGQNLQGSGLAERVSESQRETNHLVNDMKMTSFVCLLLFCSFDFH